MLVMHVRGLRGWVWRHAGRCWYIIRAINASSQSGDALSLSFIRQFFKHSDLKQNDT